MVVKITTLDQGLVQGTPHQEGVAVFFPGSAVSCTVDPYRFYPDTRM